MINEIVTGISRTLDAYFNAEKDTYKIYGEKIEQGLKEPCFIISHVDTSTDPLLNERRKQDYNFDIIYISKTGTRVDILSTLEKLINALKWIDLLNGDKLYGFDMRYEIVDDVGHCFVRYPITGNDYTMKDVIQSYSLIETVRDSKVESSNVQNYKEVIEQLRLELEKVTADLNNKEVELQSTETELQNTKTELATIKNELSNTQTELSDTKVKLQSAVTELSNTQAELSNTQAELQNKTIELESTKAELSTTQTELSTTQAELQSANAQLEEISTKLDEIIAIQNELIGGTV